MIIKYTLFKSIIVLPYIFICSSLIEKMFPKLENNISLFRLTFEIIIETNFILLVLYTSNCLSEFIISKASLKDYKISHAILVSILYITFNPSYKKKCILFKQKLLG